MNGACSGAGNPVLRRGATRSAGAPANNGAGRAEQAAEIIGAWATSGAAIAWLTVCALYDEAYGATIAGAPKTPASTETAVMAAHMKIYNQDEILVGFCSVYVKIYKKILN